MVNEGIDPFGPAALRSRLDPLEPDDEDMRVLVLLAPVLAGIDSLLAGVDTGDAT